MPAPRCVRSAPMRHIPAPGNGPFMIRRCLPASLLAMLLLSAPLQAQSSDAVSDPAPPPATDGPPRPSLLSDIKAYYDTQVRTHFIKSEGPNVGANSEDLQDAIPTVVVLGGTWLYASYESDRAGHLEAWNMLEATGLSVVTAEVLKFAAGRQDPYQTSDPNEWFKSGHSFPSLHATAAFAVGTVLAESGNDEYRWIRRVLGYGLGIATSYERLRHNAHWLSDTVAGAALGSASARFTMNRHAGEVDADSRFALVPVPGGAMLTYHLTLK
jgi:membrane-associated phospholipid phosphatase